MPDELQLDDDALTFLINHVFLPPKLPQSMAGMTNRNNRILIELLEDSAASYSTGEKDKHSSEKIEMVQKMLASLREIGVGGICAATLKAKISDMQPGDLIALYITAQNAGLLLRHVGEEIIFSSFEVSPTNAEVMGATGRLVCAYPGPIVAVKAEKVIDSDFLEAFTSFVERVDTEEDPQAVPVTEKAGSTVSEHRDTTDPMLVTGMLTGILRGIGRTIEPSLDQPIGSSSQRFLKRVRDDVIFSGGEVPWRRSPLWLVLRVALQTAFQQDSDHTLYKSFMLYFMADILQRSLDNSFNHDILFVMNAKVSRRAFKLQKELPDFVKLEVERVVRAVSTSLRQTWDDIQDINPPSNSWNFDSFSFDKDTRLSLKNSKEYINGIPSRPSEQGDKKEYQPPSPTSERIPSDMSDMPSLGKYGAEGLEQYLLLFDFENWVEFKLEGWLAERIDEESTCEALGKQITAYMEMAEEAYQGCPEDIATMLLTIMELWVALDKAVRRKYPLLDEYSPEIPNRLLEPLLLPKKSQMRRLHRIENYVRSRHEKADVDNPSVLSDDVSSNTFAVRYYDNSSVHKRLRKSIETQANLDRERKKDEYQRELQIYKDLNEEVRSKECDYKWITNRFGNQRYVHSWGCKKCALTTRAKSMRIGVHEWPLPNGELKAKIIVFELECPPGFAAWRDITYRILVDISMHEPYNESSADGGSLSEYNGLKSYYKTRHQRLSLFSESKPFVVAHYREDSFPTTLDKICVNNGLFYMLYDGERLGWVDGNLGKSDVRPMSTYELPPGPYQNMRYLVGNTTHTSNEVISSQSKCSNKLSLHEYAAFGELRAGHRIQWINITRELAARNLTWSDEAVGILIMQAATQAGPSDPKSYLRESHELVEDAIFGRTLLNEIAAMWKNITLNWRESVSAHSLVVLTVRVLSLTRSEDVKHIATGLLRQARNVTLEWARNLAKKLSRERFSLEAEQKLRSRLIQITAICRSTYDVDRDDLSWVLDTHADVRTAIECAAILHDNAPVEEDILSPFVRGLLAKNRRLSFTLEPEIRRFIVKHSSCQAMDEFMQYDSPEYTAGGRWEHLDHPRDRWVLNRTKLSDNGVVHINLLTGLLLVDGVPLKRLPEDYIKHKTYFRTLGQRLFDVRPAPARSGMKYKSTDPLHEFQLYFALEDDFIVQAKKGSRTMELVPHYKLYGDFPKHMVDNYAHWLDIESKEIEFRPLSSQWRESPDNPRLHLSDMQLVVEHGLVRKRYLDVRSSFVMMIYSVLEPLESSEFIEVTVGSDHCTVEINLPRLQLVFFVNDSKQLECRQFKDMIVDKNQTLGTFVGLHSRLILRNKNDPEDDSRRKVLIPHGNVNFHIIGAHVKVSIDTSQEQKVLCYAFDIDTTLCRLVGNGSLQSRLYKVYLHALTSYCLPDRLTLRTGTEEALNDLSSAAVSSFNEPEPERVEFELLCKISALTPTRTFYPSHLKTMQVVNWDPSLPPLSQHDDFYRKVREILNHRSRFCVFLTQDPEGGTRPETAKVAAEKIIQTNPYLVMRAAIRNGAFQLAEFGGSNLAFGRDCVYTARDVPAETIQAKEAKVCALARCADDWSTSLNVTPNLQQQYQTWGKMRNKSIITLGYESPFLEVKLRKVWCSLYNICTKTTENQRYSLTFLLSTLIFSDTPIDMKLIWTLLAFATVPEFQAIPLPNYKSFNLEKGHDPSISDLSTTIRVRAVDFSDSNESDEPQHHGESIDDWNERKERLYGERLASEVKSLAQFFMDQWPCSEPRYPEARRYRLLETHRMREEVNTLFLEWYKNMQLLNHTQKAQRILDKYVARTRECLPPVYIFSPPPMHAARKPTSQISIADVSAPKPMETLLEALHTTSKNTFELEYVQSLSNSFQIFEQQSAPPVKHPETLQTSQLGSFRLECQARVEFIFDSIRDRLKSVRVGEHAQSLLCMAGLWPRITPTSLLGLLATSKCAMLELRWKRVLVDYGLALTELQWATRQEILALTYDKNKMQPITKMQYPGHQSWDPMEQPDWLLLELENNLLIRSIQADLANQMISPESGQSSVFQLNMGEGKSSVIVPIVAASLADCTKLVRVVVLKPLSTQMFRLLVGKLSGLINRQIFYMPFSRNVKVDSNVSSQIRSLYEECLKSRGILLVQPEHVLSFKLMGLEMLAHPETRSTAESLLQTQHWLEENARDILDESDEILDVRYQLIYTIGDQKRLEHSPDRWIIIQQLFDRLASYGSFPFRILGEGAGLKIVEKLVNDISSGKRGCELPSISFRLWSVRMQQLSMRFIRDPSMSEEESQELISFCGESDFKTLLLLRGLLAHGILVTALQYRWRVDYGLDETRKALLAVPYRAKDCPAPRAEYGHPDMALILTSLSYYYGGLTNAQLQISLTELKKSNNSDTEYELWINHGPVPEEMKTLSSVNMEDPKLLEKTIFPILRHRKSVIDYYLRQVVFPQDAKEFPHKLSTSGWDLAEERTYPSTGFSGTNDNRFLLPMSIQQADIVGNAGTNAKVLHNLLKPENNHYKYVTVAEGCKKVDILLKTIIEESPNIHVILDVGAQILIRNEEVAEKLLELGCRNESSPQAVVYFDENDEIMVRRRDGITEVLLFSSFADNLDRVYVYLDEAHTRGTDLKLPPGSRAAVTLGPRLTKDRLVQACMRMRQLGNIDGHTIMYFAPEEVHSQIEKIARQRSQGTNIGAIDVLQWAISESRIKITQNVPLWATQGLSYGKRQKAWLNYWNKGSMDYHNADILFKELKEPESQTLEQLYGIGHSSDDSTKYDSNINVNNDIGKKCSYFGVNSLHRARIHEEQEREVAQETEKEEEPELPGPADPANHSVTQSIIDLVTSGMKPAPGTFIPAFDSLVGTFAADGKGHIVSGWSKRLLVTKDFTDTIKPTNKYKLDDYLRPVKWILSFNDSTDQCLAIISPFEANELLPLIRNSNYVRLHVYSPRVTKDMKPFDSMEFFTLSSAPSCIVGRDLVRELNIFSGQLCFSSFDEYKSVCAFLALYLGTVRDDDLKHIHNDGGYMSWEWRQTLGLNVSPFRSNPVNFVKRLLVCRRKGQDYLGSHMGQLLRKILLKEKDFN
ncbi:hypothetical protein BDD12DRAFT_887667 [Trichophaea hybrida]|nr:hypothetical protein BDD12DRAFT_887667 [Trichophaea hybrida]